MFHLHLLEGDQYVVKLVNECVLALHPFLVHLKPSVVFVEVLLKSFVPGFKSIKLGFNHRINEAALIDRTYVLWPPYHFLTRLLDVTKSAVVLGNCDC